MANKNTQRKSRRSPADINTNRNTRSNSKASNANSRNKEQNNGSRYSPLSNLSEERDSPVRQKITPIIVRKNGDNLVNINKMLTELCKGKFTLRHLGDSVSIRTTSITDHELIKKKLKDNNKMFHTFTPTDRRDTKTVMKGLSPDWDAKDIYDEIGKKIEVESVTKMTTKNMGIYPMYIIRFKGHIPMTQINQVGYIFNMRIYWEKYSPKNRVTQCYRCQQYGHGQRNCNEAPKCLKCGKDHETKTCSKPKAPTCALCSGPLADSLWPHLANSKKCPRYETYKDKTMKKKNQVARPREFVRKDAEFPALKIKVPATPLPPPAPENPADTASEYQTINDALNELKSAPYLQDLIGEIKELARIANMANTSLCQIVQDPIRLANLITNVQ
ncbi:hypothetical protein M8J77_004719 [Diaphorina citri]|nr:hypothetical protein M8J77_004719 [Diaphorina citri]